MLQRNRLLLIVTILLLISGNPVTIAQQTTPQNGRIAFSSNETGNYQIYTMNSDGSDVQRITFSDNDDEFPDWSPDGTRIVFESNTPPSTDVYIINLDGSPSPTFLVENATYPAWSPDGNTIAFTRWKDGSAEIYTIETDGTNLTKIVNNMEYNYSLFPVWSPDAMKILYVATDEIVGARSTITESFDLITVDIATRELNYLYSVNEEGIPDWTSTQSIGEIVLNFGGLASTPIYRLNASGSSQTAIIVTSEPDPFGDFTRKDEHPSWSPDGTQIAFSSSINDVTGNWDYDIYVTDVENMRLINLTSNNDSHEKMPDWGIMPVQAELEN